MARSIETISQEIKTIAQTKPALNGMNLTDLAEVSEVLSWIEVTAHALHIAETKIDDARNEINEKIEAQEPGTRNWYQLQCFKFQLNDQLQNDGTYAVIDTTKQIITRASVIQETSGVITIKVAKGIVGSEEALSSTELQQFTNYIEKIKFAGNIISVISLNADELKLTGTIYYDGVLDIATIQSRVQVALDQFLATGIDFNGDLYVNKIIDALQPVSGLIDVQFSDIRAIVGLLEYPIDRVYSTSAGYIVESPTFPFSDTINYVPQ